MRIAPRTAWRTVAAASWSSPPNRRSAAGAACVAPARRSLWRARPAMAGRRTGASVGARVALYRCTAVAVHRHRRHPWADAVAAKARPKPTARCWRRRAPHCDSPLGSCVAQARPAHTMTHPFDWTTAYPSRACPVFARNIVSHLAPAGRAGRAAHAAQRRQRGRRRHRHRGGADHRRARAATASAPTPSASSGTASSCTASTPRAARRRPGRPSYFRRKYGADATTPPKRGWDAVTVPGAVAALGGAERALRQAALRRPAGAGDRDRRARLRGAGGACSRNGPRPRWPSSQTQPGFAEAFLPRGRAPQVGERFPFPAAARTLRAIAETKGEAFYRGEIAAGAGALRARSTAAR